MVEVDLVLHAHAYVSGMLGWKATARGYELWWYPFAGVILTTLAFLAVVPQVVVSHTLFSQAAPGPS